MLVSTWWWSPAKLIISYRPLGSQIARLLIANCMTKEESVSFAVYSLANPSGGRNKLSMPSLSCITSGKCIRCLRNDQFCTHQYFENPKFQIQTCSWILHTGIPIQKRLHGAACVRALSKWLERKVGNWIPFPPSQSWSANTGLVWKSAACTPASWIRTRKYTFGEAHWPTLFLTQQGESL